MQGEQTNTEQDEHLSQHDDYPSKIHRFLRTKSGVRYFFAAVGLILVTGIGLILLLLSQPEPTPSATSTVPKPKQKFYSPLTGLPVADEAATKKAVTAVMIENSPDARPQSGLKDAGVVYEAIAEGGITRFVALYQESRPNLVGPVRSVRPYYVEWASAYDPAVAHIGGSKRALDLIRSGEYGVDMDQFFNAGTFWRANDREAPHNVYTDFNKLDALRESKGKTSSTFTAFARGDSKTPPPRNASTITIGVSSGSFLVEYSYDEASETYLRSHNGVAHDDREKGRIAPSVVVALKVVMSLGFEDGNREQITTTGEGQAYIFQNGSVTEATWQRSDVKSPLKLVGSDGKDIILSRGQTWITALAQNKAVTWQ
ncbi:MAG: DUF3048 domain-containing protein [Candidatus Saccharimonadales bacterium]